MFQLSVCTVNVLWNSSVSISTYRMKNFFFLFLLATMFCVFDASLVQLCKQMKQYVDRCLAYDNYGCWCGTGGSGKPVDSIDECCKAHDFCYKEIKEQYSCHPYWSKYAFNNGRCGENSSSCILKKIYKTFEYQDSPFL